MPKDAPPIADDQDTDFYPTDIGVRLRQLRKARKLTIAHLADHARVSAGMISQIERCTANPSINTLQRLRAALQVNLWELLEDRASDRPAQPATLGSFVRRKLDRPRIVVGRTRLVKELLSPQSDRPLRFMIITLPPGGQSEDVITGQGEKGGVVLEGRVRLHVGAEDAILDEGDSFQFPSNAPHSLSNPFQAPAMVVWIMSIVDTHI